MSPTPKSQGKRFSEVNSRGKREELKLLLHALLVVFKYFCFSDEKFHHLKTPNPTIISKAKRWRIYFIPILSHLSQHSGPCFKSRLIMHTSIAFSFKTEQINIQKRKTRAENDLSAQSNTELCRFVLRVGNYGHSSPLM